jgi:predicted nucleotidyltransferase component of viral defense system
MLPQAYITEWSNRAPWPDPVQVEQDLILSRLLIEAANDELLGKALAFRGGTCLQKLHLPSPIRYSEDLDYVRTDSEPELGAIFDAFRSISAEIGLSEHRRRFPGRDSDMGTIWFDGEPTEGPGLIRIKIESNVAETEPLSPFVARRYSIDSRWWSGEAEVLTCELDDLLRTKLRALYQRRKGRDLFDLWIALTRLQADDEQIVAALTHYMGDAAFTYPQLRRNLNEKLSDPVFIDDIAGLLVEMPEDYRPHDAALLVLQRLGARLRNAPAEDEAIALP